MYLAGIIIHGFFSPTALVFINSCLFGSYAVRESNPLFVLDKYMLYRLTNSTE